MFIDVGCKTKAGPFPTFNPGRESDYKKRRSLFRKQAKKKHHTKPEKQ